jgi:hypothetical protein
MISHASRYSLACTPTGTNGSTRLDVTVTDTDSGVTCDPINVTRDTLNESAGRIASLMIGANVADVARQLGNALDEAQSEPVVTSSHSKPQRPWRAFPVELLPPVMSGLAIAGARSLCVDPSMFALPMLSIAGAAIGNTARARMSPDYHAPANVWTGVVVRSGERKSPALRAVMSPIYTRQQKAAEEYAQAVADHERDVERWKATPKKERGDSPVEPPAYPHLYLSDTTTEAIAIRLSTQPRGLAVVLDELAGLFSGMNQYRAKGGNDRESYLAFYDANAAKIDRKSATPPTIFIPRAFIAVAGMIQPGALARALGPAEFDSGLASRFLLASPPAMRATWSDGGVGECHRDAWRDLLFTLLDTPLPDQPLLIPPSDDAMRLWAAAHDRLEEDRHHERDDRVRAARAKIIGVIPRLSLIFQIVSAASGDQHASVRLIDATSMQRAIDLAEWFTYETQRVYGLLNDDGGDDTSIIARIEDNGGVVSVRELMRWSREFRTASLAEDYINSLVKEGVGRWQWNAQRGRAGQPRRVFCLLTRADADATPRHAFKNGDCVSVSSVNAGESTEGR